MSKPSGQDDLDIGAAPFLILGILWTIAGMAPLIIGLILRDSLPDMLPIIYYVLIPGAGLLIIGIGVMKRWRFIGIPAMACCAIFLLNFPLGTLLGGWALFSLWKRRAFFYPFDKTKLQEDVAPS